MFQSIREDLQQVGRGTLDLLYPPLCAVCSVRLLDAHEPICTRCLRQIERPDLDELRARVEALPGAAGVFDECFALWMFGAVTAVQTVQHALKYRNRPVLGRALGRLVGQGLLHVRPETDLDLLIPVPLARLRFLERGYNQSAQLAHGLASVLEASVHTRGLHRTRSTRTQTRLNQHERLRNTQGAFAVADAGQVRDHRVGLVDDVITTGATALAAGQVLREAGVASLSLITLAYAQPR